MDAGGPGSISIGGTTLSMNTFRGIVERGVRNAGMDGTFTTSDVNGPFDGKINSIYTFTVQTRGKEQQFIFRARISDAFRYEHVVKEKILFPILDGTLDLASRDLHRRIQDLAARKTGSHVFSSTAPPVIPVQDLFFFDESKTSLAHMYTVMRYIQGVSLYEHLSIHEARGTAATNLNASLVDGLDGAFHQAGEALGRLHRIEFPGFYPSITSIGDPSAKVKWKVLFTSRVKALLAEAATHRAITGMLPRLRDWINHRVELIDDDEPAVLFHNDFQPQNFIIDPGTCGIRAFIDFDNWGIAPREQDLVKMRYWGLRDLDPRFERAFMAGYARHQHVGPGFHEKVALYTMAWFVLVYNFEMDKVAKHERNQVVDARFPAAEVYLDEMRKILDAGE